MFSWTKKAVESASHAKSAKISSVRDGVRLSLIIHRRRAHAFVSYFFKVAQLKAAIFKIRKKMETTILLTIFQGKKIILTAYVTFKILHIISKMVEYVF